MNRVSLSVLTRELLINSSVGKWNAPWPSEKGRECESEKSRVPRIHWTASTHTITPAHLGHTHHYTHPFTPAHQEHTHHYTHPFTPAQLGTQVYIAFISYFTTGLH